MAEHDDLEGGLFEAFKHAGDGSVLSVIQRIHGTSGSVMLKPISAEVTPVRIQRDDTALGSSSDISGTNICHLSQNARQRDT